MMSKRDQMRGSDRMAGLFGLVLGIFAMATLSIGPAEAKAPLKIVAFGDSLTAGYLLANGEAFPDILQKALAERGLETQISNAGVSGDTTTGGLARLDWSVPDGTDAVLLELGANDMLRGLDPSVPRANLKAIFDRLKERKIPVFILGMRAPANYGANYAKDFDSLYADLAKANGAPLYPFMLEGVAGQAAYLLSDGLHPNAEGVEVIARKIMPQLDEFVGALR